MHMNATKIGNILQELGFTEDSIVETILVTMNIDGSYNAAPMGVKYREGLIEASPYKTSHTFGNLHRGSQASLNITDDPVLFLYAAFKDELGGPKVTDWTLNEAYVTVFLEKQYEFPISDLQVGFKLSPTKLNIQRNLPRVFSRGRSEAIEAIVHATRIKVFHTEGRHEKTQELQGRLNECFSVVTRVSADDSPEMQVVETLNKLLTKWGITC